MNHEEIKQALDAATPGPWEYSTGDYETPCTVHAGDPDDGSFSYVAHELTETDAHLIAKAPTWLRNLLEDRDFWKNLYEQERELSSGQKEYLRKENERLTKERDEALRLHRSAMHTIENADSHVVALREELEQIKKERDAYYENAKYTEAAFHEVTRLRSQLAEKDKVLEWYAEQGNWQRRNGVPSNTMIDEGSRALHILAKFHKEEETK